MPKIANGLKTKSIQWRLVFIYVLVIVVVMQAVSIYLISDISSMLENSFEESIAKTAALLVDKLVDRLDDTEYMNGIVGDEERYQRPNKDYSEGEIKDYGIYVLDADSKVIYGSDDMEFWVDDLIIATAPEGVTYQGSIRTNTDTNTRYQSSCMKIVGDDGKTQGYVYIVAAMEDQVYSKVNDIRRTLLMGTGITLVIALALSLMLAQTITRPIVDLTYRAAEIARGNFSQQIDVASDDEIGQLGNMFNSMASQLSQTLGEISNEKSKMDAIFTYMSNGVIAFDTAGELIHINPRAKELLVLPEGDQQVSLVDLIDRLAIDDIGAMVKSNRLSIREVTLPSAEGRIIRIQQAPFQREERLNGVIMVLEDITEQQKLERMRSEFLANVSHELKTPLTNIQIRVHALQDYLEEREMTPPQLLHAVNAGWRILDYTPEQVKATLPTDALDTYDLTLPQLRDLYQWQISEIQRKMLPVIEAETTRMNKLVHDLLQLSQLDSDQIELNKRSFMMQELVEEVVERMQTTAKKKQSTSELNVAEPCVPIVADHDAIEQVVVNIISNAIKYSPNHSKVVVDLTQDSQFVWVNIKDNGIGIPAQDLPRIFERFYRVDKARSRQLGGTGLGLAIAKQIIEAHGGAIDIHSELGQGTDVRFSIPKQEVG